MTAAFPLWQLVKSTARDSGDIPPDLPTMLLSAALKHTPVPDHVLAACPARIRVEKGSAQFPPARMGLIKLVLNRRFQGDDQMTESLDPSRNIDPAYVCGRLFACLAYIQGFERDPKKHGFGQDAPIVAAYYGTASAAPRSVFGPLLRQTQHRLNKLSEEYGGFVTNRNKELEEFACYLGNAGVWQADFPPFLDLHKQGRFALGFYHQRGDYRRQSTETRAAKKAATG